jgi:type IV secretory pathway TrbL component
MFSFLWSLHFVFCIGRTSFHSHQQWIRAPFSTHPHQYLLVVVFLMITILTGVQWNLSVVLMCSFFMGRDSEYFFMSFLAIWISSLEKPLFSSVAHFYIGSLIWGRV